MATTGAAAAAFQIDPEVLTEVSTPATGLWIPAPSTGEIVRIDGATGDVTARVDVGDPGADLVLAERDHGVIVVNRTAGRVALVDPALHEVLRAVGSVASSEATVDIGPDGIVTASGSLVALVDIDVTRSTSARVAPSTRSAVADGEGAQVENAATRVKIAADGSVEDEVGIDGVLVRVGERVLVAGSDAVRTLDGSRAACFDAPVVAPEHVVGADDGWVVAVSGRTVHVADVSSGGCAAVTLPVDDVELGRPVVAGGRVYVPERRSGVVHIVEPWQGTVGSHKVLLAGDIRVRSYGDFVAAYDAGSHRAALLDPDGLVRLVDTSVDERGIAAEVGDSGSVAVVQESAEGEPGDNGDAGTGGDDLGADNEAPVIDAGVLATTLRNPADDEALPDDDLVANFAFSATTVTVGETARFVDESTGDPDSWLWDFGDGTGAQGPTADKAWDEPGTYPVTLRVSRGEETDEISLAITVVPPDTALPPAADFVFSSPVVSVGQPIAFEDRSDGEITRWRWEFGDGTSATAPNVTKSWTEPGRYEVRLTVANEQGSDSAAVFVDVIESLEAPVAVLTAPQTEVDLGAPVAFRGSSSTGPATFAWDFGDGRTGSGADVVHVFLTEGTFTVTLTATNDAGVSTDTVEVVVAPPTQPPTAAIGALPSVIEVGDVVTLSSLSTNSPDVETWSFGDGQTATGARVTHTWESPGSYQLALTASNSAGTDTVTETIDVVAELPAPIARIGDYNETPWVDETTLFIDASVDATSWLWDFGDGATSTAPDPLHAFTSPGQKIVTLTVSNRNGSDSTSVVVEPSLEPAARFSVSSDAVRVGELVIFTDESVKATSWSWDFGDDATSSAQNPAHTYDEAGTFEVVLTITSATGDQYSFSDVINVDPAAPNLSGITRGPENTDTITTGTTSSFTAVTDPASGPIDRYRIDFDDETAVSENTSGTFSHVFAASGTYAVTMWARGPLGDLSEPVTRTFTVVDPPAPVIVGLTAEPKVATVGVEVRFTPQITGSIVGYEWNYEGTGYVAGGATGAHVFSTPGTKQVLLRVTDVLDRTATRSVTVTVNPKPAPTAPVAVPGGTVLTNTSVNLSSSDSGGRTGLTWDWEIRSGATVITRANAGPSIDHVFDTAGSWTVTVTATDALGVSGSNVAVVTVEDPPEPLVAFFTAALTGTSRQVQFTDRSTGPPIDSWSWDFGDAGAVGDTTAADPLVTFSGIGVYSVTLTVTSGGDVDQFTAPVVVV